MKALLAVVGGFLFTLAVFGSGSAVAMWLLTAKPVQQAELGDDAAYLWSREPRTVTAPTPGLERIPARSVEANVNVADDKEASLDTEPMLVDRVTTGSVQTAALDDQVTPEPALPEAHTEWCSSRYRSYRSSDNSYTTYSGGSRSCTSPFLEPSDSDQATAAASQMSGEAGLFAAVDDQPAVSGDHVDYCFSRYRSYRPEDNTYQPYGGGSRRQCE